ncbi:amino acid adenylation domain-containing protein [Tengunoibacter tsumagoiensis]|uniref:Carrier domain-containing protein n=1 Tax=Tengunoibacter tsumagoiensis TaxID=2014871 RepID=A0A402A964_9CHLR|nr:non-ribosomal peptide synthetase [Tengunoibacter tsumagoiensis]GCE15669.1 hypothetical protein KTT_55280 [Tengunoibacter tsumagoiensis]
MVDTSNRASFTPNPQQQKSSLSEKLALLEYLLQEQEIERTPAAPVFEARPATTPLCASSSQQRFWFLDQLYPGSALYTVISAHHLHDQIESRFLQQSIDCLVERYEILRTLFISAPDGRCQPLVLPTLSVPLLCKDLRQLSPSVQQYQFSTFMKAQTQHPFELSQGPLLRCSLLQIADDEYVFILAMHHSITDEWSIQLFLRELMLCYEAYRTQRAPDSVGRQIFQYSDFAYWQQQWLASPALQELLTTWRKEYLGEASQQDAFPYLELPTDYPRATTSSIHGAIRSRLLPSALVSQLKTESLNQNMTLPTFFLAAFFLLLQRYTRQEDLVLGMPITGRTRVEFETMPGCFVNTLVVRCRLTQDLFWREWLEQVQQAMLTAYNYQELPFEKIIESLSLERSLQQHPLFQVLFSYQNPVPIQQDMQHREVRSLPVDTGTAKFDLSLFVYETASELRVAFEYKTDLFASATIDRMLTAFLHLLQECVSQPGLRCRELSLQHAQQVQHSAPPREDQSCTSLSELFEQQVKRDPEAIALRYVNQQLSYRQLNQAANQLARQLQKLNVGPEMLIAVYLERSCEFVIAQLAILKVGAAYLPLDPVNPPERLMFMLNESRSPLLLTQSSLYETIAEYHGTIVSIDQLAREQDESSEANDNLALSLNPQQLAYVIYTSGSTGQPKGIEVEHQQVIELLAATQSYFQFTSQDVWTLFHSFAFDFSVWELWGALSTGGKCVIVPPSTGRSPTEFWTLICNEQVSVLNQTPTAFQRLLQSEEVTNELAKSSLRWIIFGGERLDFASLLPWLTHNQGQLTQLVNMYGITETTVHVTLHPIDEQEIHHPVGSILGSELAHEQLYLLDEQLCPVPDGVAGEIYVGGRGVARGYLHQPALTATRFIPHPFSTEPGARLYKSGDRARRLASGELIYLGRTDQQIKLRGFRIELAEIAHTLQLHPEIQKAVVLLDRTQKTNEQIVAYLIPRQEEASEQLTHHALRQYMQERLPDYMNPVHYFWVEHLPLTANGKLDAQALLQLPQTLTALKSGTVYSPPRTAVERLLTTIWEQGLARSPIGIHDNFFALGGDSIRSLDVIARMKRQGLYCSLPQLFHYQTIAELADHISLAEQPAPAVVLPFSLLEADDYVGLPVTSTDAYPLTLLQQGMLYHMDWTPERPLYQNVFSLHLQGPLHYPTFLIAIQTIVDHHAILRTTFDLTTYSRPLQIVHAQAVLPCPLTDLSHLAFEEQEKQLATFLRAEESRPFNLTDPPLLRFHVHVRSDQTFQLTMTEHHALLDGWSLHLLLAELFSTYFLLLQGKALPPRSAEVPAFRDYVAREQAILLDPAYRDYWYHKLTHTHTQPLLPTSIPGSDGRFYYATHLFTPEEKAGLRQSGLTVGAPLKSVLLAIHCKVMSLLSGSTEIITGLTCEGRPEEIGGTQTCGLFLNVVPFCLSLRQSTWKQLIQTTFAEECELLPFRQYPLAAIQKEHPLVLDTLFTYLHFHALTPLKQAHNFTILETRRHEQTNFALNASFSLDPFTDELSLLLDVDTTRISPALADTLLTCYQQVITSMLRNPEADTRQCFLPSQDYQDLLIDWNMTAQSYPADACLHELFTAQAKRTPEACAIHSAQGTITYRELDEQSNQLAHLLRQYHDVGPETPVGLYLARKPALVVGLLGILKAGGAYVPLDPAYPRERCRWIFQHAQVKLIITQSELTSELADSSCPYLCIDSQHSELSRQSRAALASNTTAMTGQHLAYIIFTSGSTGDPKGVMISHQSLINYVFWSIEAYGVSHKAGAPVHTSPGFDLTVTSLFPPLITGKTLFFLSEQESSTELQQLLSTTELSPIKMTPAHLQQWQHLLIEQEELPPIEAQTLVIGGEALYAEQLAWWRHLASAAPLRWINEYGPTEATVGCCVYELPLSFPQEGSVPIGRPIANTRLYVLDAFLHPVPRGFPGELYISGAGLARGYQQAPEWTAERFLPDPFQLEPGQRMYQTGDRVRFLPDGTLEYLGRLDEQVKWHGFRIELREIQLALTQAAIVQECCVLMRKTSNGEPQIAAYLVPQPDAVVSVNGLRDFLATRLPYFMVPGLFFVVEALPVTVHGKVDHAALLQISEEHLLRTEQTIRPQTFLQIKLAEIWQRTLSIESIGIHDHFFALGGDSLLATQVIARMRSELQITVPLRILFEQPTITQLATSIEARQAATEEADPLTDSHIPRRSNDGPAPLSFSQQRLWFLDQLQPLSTTYTIFEALRLEGALNPRLLIQSFEAVIQRHESLRTRFQVQDEQPVQIILPSQSFDLQEIDLSLHASAEEELQRIAREESQQPFHLATGPLLRGRLLYLQPHTAVLLVSIHHCIADGWSLQILWREVALHYQAFLQQEQPQIAALPLQYRDFAIWQQQWQQSAHFERQLAYWRHQLAGAPPLLALPTDHPRPPIQTTEGAELNLIINPDVTAQLKKLCQQEHCTLFMLLLSAWNIVLHRYSGQDDLLIGTTIAGRTHSELEPLIGYFANTVVLRTDLGGDPTCQELLQRVKEVALAAYAHQEMPFEKVVEALQPVRNLSYNPIFQVLFVFQNLPPYTQQFADITVHPTTLAAKQTARFDLALALEEQDSVLIGTLEYQTALFEEVTMRRMLAHFQTILSALATNLTQSIHQLPMLTPPELALALQQQEQSDDIRPAEYLPHRFIEQARRTPHAQALITTQGTLTYQELDQQSNQVAHLLLNKGVGADVPVGICLPRDCRLIIGLLGILKAGGAYVPIDPDYPIERQQWILQHAQISLLLTHTQPPFALEQRVEVLIIDDDHSEYQHQPLLLVPPSLHGQQLAYSIYTSGSTGRPKGVMITHDAVRNILSYMQHKHQICEQDTIAALASFAFDMSIPELFLPLISGARLLLIEQTIARDGQRLHSVLQEHHATLMQATPTTWQMLLQLGLPLPSLHTMISGAEALPQEVATQLLHSRGAEVAFYNYYGPTETTVWSAAQQITAHYPSVRIGQPIAHTRLYLLDRYLQPVPMGVIGEIYLGGSGLARGYQHQPELTAASFIPDPWSSEERPGLCLYKTGDLARYHTDGSLEYLGRSDQQIKVHGFRIEPAEIEALLEQHPAIAQAIVVAQTYAEHEKRLVAYLIARAGSSCTSTQLRSYLARSLPDYMHPTTFLWLQAFPLTPNGKLDRKQLSQHNGKQYEEEGRIPARDALEWQLVQIWQEVLATRPIGINENFFARGGNSFSAVRLMNRIRQQYSYELPLSLLFQEATIEQLAAILRQEKGETELTPLVPIQAGGSKRPFFCIHPGGGGVLCYRELAEVLGEEQPFYGLEDLRQYQETIDERATIEDLATTYVRAVQLQQPAGPYLLGGWSFGGIVAFEMAQQLQKQGEKVALLALFDSQIPDAQLLPLDESGELLHFAHEQARSEGKAFSLTESELKQLAPAERIPAILHQIEQARLDLPEISLPWLERFLRLAKVGRAMLQSYQPQHYAGPLILFLAQERAHQTAADRIAAQWQALAIDPIKIYSTPGTHDTMIVQPHVDYLGRNLAEAIARSLESEEEKGDPAMMHFS